MVLFGVVLISGLLLNYLLFLCSIKNTAITTSMIGVSKSTLTSFIGLFCFDTFHPSHIFMWVENQSPKRTRKEPKKAQDPKPDKAKKTRNSKKAPSPKSSKPKKAQNSKKPKSQKSRTQKSQRSKQALNPIKAKTR